MGIDPRIALGVQPVQLQDPTNQLAKMLEIQGAQDNRKLNMLKMGEYERGLADENQMRDLTRQAGGDVGKLRDLTYGAGNYKQGLALDKTIGERKTTDLANRKTELEGHLKKFEVAGQIMSNVRDQASWEVARQQTAQVFGPDAAAQMPPQYDPRLVEQKRLQAMSVKDQLEQKWKAMEYTTPKADAVLSATTSTENNKRSVGASYANASATRAVAASNVEAAKIKGDRDTEMKIADDYRTQSKAFKEVSDAYKTINATLDKATTSAAATLAGATKFMKLLDPGSVVRESELGMALAATGAFDRATNYVNTLRYGKVLTKAQAEDFKNITGQIYGAAQAQQKAIDANYTQQAKTYGLRPEMIVQDLGQNAPAASGKPAAPAAGGLPQGWKVQAR